MSGVVREDFLLEADYRHSLDYTKNFSGRRNEKMEGLEQCFPKGNLWNWGKRICVSREKQVVLAHWLRNLVKPCPSFKVLQNGGEGVS